MQGQSSNPSRAIWVGIELFQVIVSSIILSPFLHLIGNVSLHALSSFSADPPFLCLFSLPGDVNVKHLVSKLSASAEFSDPADHGNGSVVSPKNRTEPLRIRHGSDFDRC